MRIGELARLADVSPKAIRRYEALGLVVPARQANGYREYDDDTVRLVREIRVLNRLGIPVEETRPFLECLVAGGEHGDDCPESLAEYHRAIDDLTAQIELLTARRDGLVQRLREAAYRRSVATPAPEVDDLMTLPRDLVVPVDDGATAHLPGLRMPSLALGDTDGARIDLAALGTGRTIIYLYPLTGHPDADIPVGWNEIPGARGCTPQACGFRDHYAELRAAGVQHLYGLSSQTSLYQREVVTRLSLPFTMLSDPDFRLADELSLPTFEFDGTRLYKRQTLVIRDGVIEHVFYPVFPPDQHAGQLLRWLHDNEVTP
ncbi:redoxin family protein [Nocardia sp. ET3-3]|uniref:Redoxin family protein n=1 Tax=Nocardia terrae TaxID=2675851 RepID=A0A7K1UXF4_9NOCA|nr:MerR family transcriptional regulator [Nocardia terrae]MVU78578.1 redoxin family protein [Nocardia terrae]